MINFKRFLFLTLCLFSPLATMGASSPMVERHIFSPEPEATGSYKSPLTLKLEKELIFTGVIISSHGKWAMIREKARKTDVEISGRHKEGDEIKGMVIRKIGNNFLILAGEGKEVRLNLYHEGKPRPAMPSGASPASSESRTAAIQDKRKSPFPNESKMPARRPGEKPAASSPAKNPFLEALGRGQPNNSPPSPGDDTPFPQEALPNPFSQENPDPFLTDPPLDSFPE